MLALAVIVALALSVGTRLLLDTSPSVSSNKSHYTPGEAVVLAGHGLAANSSLEVVVERPNGSVVLGDGSETPGWDAVSSDADGDFTYSYVLDDQSSITGEYVVRVYDAGAIHVRANELDECGGEVGWLPTLWSTEAGCSPTGIDRGRARGIDVTDSEVDGLAASLDCESNQLLVRTA